MSEESSRLSLGATVYCPQDSGWRPARPSSCRGGMAFPCFPVRISVPDVLSFGRAGGSAECDYERHSVALMSQTQRDGGSKEA